MTLQKRPYVPDDSVFHLFPPLGFALPEWQTVQAMPRKEAEALYKQAYRALMHWRNTELKDVLVQRDGMCWMPDCDGHSLSSMHEAVRRGHVMGWQPKTRRLAIYTGLNTVILCDRCHGTAREPAIEEIAAFMADRYGLDVYLDWLLSLEFKSAHPLQGWGPLADALESSGEWTCMADTRPRPRWAVPLTLGA